LPARLPTTEPCAYRPGGPLRGPRPRPSVRAAGHVLRRFRGAYANSFKDTRGTFSYAERAPAIRAVTVADVSAPPLPDPPPRPRPEDWEHLPDEGLLDLRFNQLGVRIEGSWLE